MKLTISCPDCGKTFTIDLLKAQREIDRLRAENTMMKIQLDRWRDDKHTLNDTFMPDFFKDIFNA